MLAFIYIYIYIYIFIIIVIIIIVISIIIISSSSSSSIMKTSFQSTRSGAGLRVLLWDCRARACVKKECFFTDTGMSGNKASELVLIVKRNTYLSFGPR